MLRFRWCLGDVFSEIVFGVLKWESRRESGLMNRISSNDTGNIASFGRLSDPFSESSKECMHLYAPSQIGTRSR